MLTSEEKPCHQLFLVCYLQNSMQHLKEVLSACSICIRALLHVCTHTSTQRTKQTDLLLSAWHTQPGTGYVHGAHQWVLSGLWLPAVWQICILIRHEYSCNNFHNSSGLHDAKCYHIVCHCHKSVFNIQKAILVVVCIRLYICYIHNWLVASSTKNTEKWHRGLQDKEK